MLVYNGVKKELTSFQESDPLTWVRKKCTKCKPSFGSWVISNANCSISSKHILIYVEMGLL